MRCALSAIGARCSRSARVRFDARHPRQSILGDEAVPACAPPRSGSSLPARSDPRRERSLQRGLTPRCSCRATAGDGALLRPRRCSRSRLLTHQKRSEHQAGGRRAASRDRMLSAARSTPCMTARWYSISFRRSPTCNGSTSSASPAVESNSTRCSPACCSITRTRDRPRFGQARILLSLRAVAGGAGRIALSFRRRIRQSASALRLCVAAGSNVAARCNLQPRVARRRAETACAASARSRGRSVSPIRRRRWRPRVRRRCARTSTRRSVDGVFGVSDIAERRAVLGQRRETPMFEQYIAEPTMFDRR